MWYTRLKPYTLTIEKYSIFLSVRYFSETKLKATRGLSKTVPLERYGHASFSDTRLDIGKTLSLSEPYGLRQVDSLSVYPFSIGHYQQGRKGCSDASHRIEEDSDTSSLQGASKVAEGKEDRYPKTILKKPYLLSLRHFSLFTVPIRRDSKRLRVSSLWSGVPDLRLPRVRTV